ncbi:UDP-N-acetylglucosamine 1-carboxyvinyltransferase, partial [Patescibacteria group bacterium]|nr:UDP-N-acetylglucosamine 1-carboxyvinyltransferase [Patescibacteria group bacterium]
MKDKFIIKGLGNKEFLSGKIKVNGAKNAVLPVMASAVLFKSGFSIKNVPFIEDLNRLDEIFKGLGIEMTKESEGEYFINTEKIESREIHEEASKKLSASIIFSGPVLARVGEL